MNIKIFNAIVIGTLLGSYFGDYLRHNYMGFPMNSLNDHVYYACLNGVFAFNLDSLCNVF